MTKVKPCTCSNAYQDKNYGNQQRVMNLTTKEQAGKKVYRCTVCKTEKT